MAARQAICVVNRLSETVAKKGSVLPELAASLGRPCFAESVFDRLPEIVEAAQNVDNPIVVIDGGDGTAQGVISAFLNAAPKVLPEFLLLRGGMTNQVAKNIGLKSRKAQAVRSALSSGGSKTTPLLRVTSPDNPDYYGFLFSTGAIPMVTDYTKSKVHRAGIGGSAAVAMGIIRGVSGRREDVMHPTPITMSLEDGQSFDEAHLGTVATTLPNLILGLDPFWGEGNGAIRLTYAAGDTRRLLQNVISLWQGNKSKDRRRDGLQSFNSDRVKFYYNGPIVLDGEALPLLGEFELSVSPPIRFINAS